MATCMFIVQGEGRGHLSQSMALKEYLEEAGHTVGVTFAGSSAPGALPSYFREAFGERLEPFSSPYFLRTPNKKGIYVGRSLLFNLVRSFLYLREARRIREMIEEEKPDLVFNFYDLVGALALRKVTPGVIRIGVGHHFFLHLDGYRCGKGAFLQKRLLSMLTRIIMRSCDRVLALSFREEEGNETIRVIPPLIRRRFRIASYQPGERFLVYLLHEGFIYNLIQLAREDPEFSADVFTALVPEAELPSGISLHPLDEQKFMSLMCGCRGLITTGGFDTVAEAAYLGVPLVVVPSQHHYEQRCNSVDMERTGIGITADRLLPGIEYRTKPFDNREYRSWVNRAEELILQNIGK